MKTIMHILNTGKYSGAENVAISIIEHFQNKYNLVYVSLNGPIETLLQNKGIQYYGLEKLNRKNLKIAIKKYHPDIIHAHDYTAGIIAGLTTGSIPIINHLHNNSPWLKRYGKNSFAYLFSTLKYKKILTVSESIQDEYVFGEYISKKTMVVGNPVDIKKIISTNDKAGDNIKYDVVFLGRLSSQKKPLLFLKIVDEIRKRKPDVRVAMIGDGELRGDVEGKIISLKLEDTVDLLGFQSNPYGYLKESKVMCMPSEWEGYGLAAVEALAFGKPVVCSGAGGLKYIVTEECGKICRDVDEYVVEIERLLNDEEYYLEKSERTIERAEKLDNAATYFKTLDEVYTKILR